MKKFISIFLAGVLVLSTTACNQGNTQNDTNTNQTINLKVWGSQEDQELLNTLITDFKDANPNKSFDIQLGVVGEGEAKNKILEDPDAAADVFAFSNDQILDLVNAGALYEITRNIDTIKNANIEGSVEAAMVDGKLYAYPMTADNGYFLYYDKSVISDKEAQSLDSILKAANRKNKKVYMDVSNGWFIASFFLGGGGTIKIDDEGKQIVDFNNAKGLKVAEAIKKFTADKAFTTGDDAVITGGMGETIAAGVSGTWNAEVIEEALGDNFGATKLPTFTMDGEQVQMSSFAGYKLLGVSKSTKHPIEAMELAEFLTNESSQQLRFEKRALGPSNKNVSNSEEVAENKALAALKMQEEFAQSQKYVLGSFWTPTEAFGAQMEAKDYKKSLQEQLDDMVKAIKG